ncbi:hypothetical protein [uncultured Vagococcus sp.]|uniref:hypothetical protein n=1 Tax=uncultured Vagococcus sp. TaxID=189676 RepID=UPI0028CFDF9D|nr:hypothetical protein [uncultured Vagococcus sp.]
MLQKYFEEQLVTQKQLKLLISRYGELPNMSIDNHAKPNGTFQQYDKETGERLFYSSKISPTIIFQSIMFQFHSVSNSCYDWA